MPAMSFAAPVVVNCEETTRKTECMTDTGSSASTAQQATGGINTDADSRILLGFLQD